MALFVIILEIIRHCYESRKARGFRTRTFDPGIIMAVLGLAMSALAPRGVVRASCIIPLLKPIVSCRLCCQIHSCYSNQSIFCNPCDDEICVHKSWRQKCFFFQFEIVINVLVSSFRFICIPMLWVCGHYKYFTSFSAGIDFRRQNLTSVDVRFWRPNSIPALKGLIDQSSLTSSRSDQPAKLLCLHLIKHATLHWCWINVGPVSQTVAQH